MTDLAKLEDVIGHHFADRELLVRALEHSSARENTNGRDNQTLEFLGDSVLGLAVSDLAAAAHPLLEEGALTRLRASLVNAARLAELARTLDLGSWLHLGKGEEKSGGRDKDRILAAAYEAVIGAVFRDSGYTRAREVVKRHLGEAIAAGTVQRDFKTELQELAQNTGRGTPTYRLAHQRGPAHARTFEIEVVIAGRAVAASTGASRKEAEQDAARKALADLEPIGDVTGEDSR